jgi:serine/threonine-protein kinase HipA
LAPPWSSISELQDAAQNFESDTKNDDARQWLAILMAPGSFLGGARPKGNILDNDKNLWIAKFPAKKDITDKAA